MSIRYKSRGSSSPHSRLGVPLKAGRRGVLRMVKSLTPILILFLPQLSSAQCAMCRAVLESEENAAIAEGVNNGIVYLMAIPYILVAVLFYFVYKKMKS